MSWALGPHLNNALILPRGLDHPTALDHVMARGLFHVNVFTRLTGQDRQQAVPVVRGGHGHDVDGLVIQQPAKVLLGPGAFRPLTSTAFTARPNIESSTSQTATTSALGLLANILA